VKDEAYIVLIMRPPEPDELTVVPGWILTGWGAVFASSFKIAKDFIKSQYDPPPTWEVLKDGVRATLPSGEILQLLKGPIYLPEIEGNRMKRIDRKEPKLVS